MICAHPGVVDQEVDRSEVGPSAGDSRADLLPIADVAEVRTALWGMILAFAERFFEPEAAEARRTREAPAEDAEPTEPAEK